MVTCTCWMVLLVLYAYAVPVECQTESVNIAAFNVQIFGVSKFGDASVVGILSKIVRRYDIILIQEIRDISETVIYSFLDVVNNDSMPEGVEYAMNVSERLGRTNSKEQYAFMYRMDKVSVLAAHQYNDTMDLFERPPYSLLIYTKKLDIPHFFLMGIHIQPSSAFDEINALLPAYQLVQEVFQTPYGVMLGDLNADCTWLSQRRYDMLDLVTDGRFDWLITMDTTTNDNNCSYDRIVVGESVRSVVVEGSAGVLRFDELYNLSREETLAVSDHYPVHFSLQGTPRSSGASNRTLSTYFLSLFFMTISLVFNY